MKKSDIQPNSIYRTLHTNRRSSVWFRTGDEVTFTSAKPWTDGPDTRRTHLLLWSNSSPGKPWNDGEDDVEHVEVLRWVDNTRLHGGTAHGDELLDLTFQPEPFGLQLAELSELGWRDEQGLPEGSLPADWDEQVSTFDAAYKVWSDAYEAEEARTGQWPTDEWDEANPEPAGPKYVLREVLEAKWGTKFYNVTTEHRTCTTRLPRAIAYSSLSGPFTEQDRAAEVLADRARRDEAAAEAAVAAAEYSALEAIAKEFVTSALANIPDALLEQTTNGLPRAVESAREHGWCDWSIAHVDGSYRNGPNAEAPDASSLVGMTATALAAITHAWREVYGDDSWEEIVAGVYARHASDEVVNHLYVEVLKTEWGEAKAKRIAQYLPDNYEVVSVRDFGSHGGEIVIAGVDRQGWTAVDYVIPRLASGLIIVKDHRKTRRPVEAIVNAKAWKKA